MNMKAVLISVVALSYVPTSGWAQKMERPKSYDVGDKAVHNVVSNNKALRLEDETIAVTSTEIQISTKLGEKIYETVLSTDDFALTKHPCLSNLQQCTFTPGLKFVDFPLEKGKKWSGTMTVEGETFKSAVNYERRVEAVEKIRVPAGQFEAFKIAFSGTIKGTDSKGVSYSGKESGADWFALVSGKLVAVKVEYKNSFGEKFTQELISISFK